MMPFSGSSRLTTDHPDDSGLPWLYLALPVMDEPVTLERTLGCIARQSYRRFSLFAIVNQPETWWRLPEKIRSCENNMASLRLLRSFHEPEATVIDRSSRGQGWTGKGHGIGYARKAVMDRINVAAGPGDVIVSLDADTVLPDGYLRSVAENFRDHPGMAAISVPYFHPAPADPSAARAILRYEIYMRHYLLNMLRIGSPYAFTALGSAMAVPVSAYRAIRGMTPRLSGEDFYFLQKLRKYGRVALWNDEIVYPEARFSGRVFFGTGPAMIRGAAGDWSGYPVYPARLFDEIGETYALLPRMYLETIETRVIRFMEDVFREKDPLLPLRANHKDPEHFLRAFHEKFDGLRILQFLKSSLRIEPGGDEKCLFEFLDRFCPGDENPHPEIDRERFSFSVSPLEELEAIRMFLFRKEMEARFSSALV